MRWGRVAVSLVLASGACLDLSGLSPPGDAVIPSEGGVSIDATLDGAETSPTTDGGGCDGGAPGAGCVVVCNGSTCGAHEICNSAATPPACECAVGYTKGASGCVFTGGPLDPGFQNNPAAWTIEPADAGVVLNASNDGGIDPGALIFSNDCKAALVRQSFPMPDYAIAEPLALELHWRTSSSMAVMIEVAGRTFPTVVTANTYQPTRICLGESAYGGNVELVLRRTNQCGYWAVDHADIVPDPSCLVPGGVVSPDFQSPGWTAADGGEMTTSGLSGVSGRLPVANPCQEPRLTGKIHVPASMTHPALAVSYKGTSNVKAELGLSGGRFGTATGVVPVVPFAQLAGTDAIERVNICLPEWARGTIRSLELSMPERGTNCGDSAPAEFLFDDLAVVDDPVCETGGLVFDPGFERAVAGSKVTYARGPKNNFDFSPSFQKITGNGVLHLRSTYPDCSSVYSTTQTASVFVSGPRMPAGMTAGAPRLTFGYRAGGATALSFTAAGQVIDSAASTASLCLPRSLAGHGLLLDFSVTNSCPASSGDLYVDDVALAWDPVCP